MVRRIGVLVCILLLVTATAWAAGERWIVAFLDGTPTAVQTSLIEASGSSVLHKLPLVNAWAIEFPADPAMADTALRFLQEQPEVRVMEPDFSLSLQMLSGGVQSELVTATDPATTGGGYPWNLHQIGLDQIKRHNHDYLGHGMRVAVIDTGIDPSHPSLANVVVRGYNARAGENPDDWIDRNGHGTHIAGIIAASLDDPYFRGIAPQAVLYAVKVLDESGSGYLSDLINGLSWLHDHPNSYRVQVVNMSLGFSQGSLLLQEVLQKLLDRGIVLVAAVGNYESTGATGEGAAGEGAAGTGCASGEGAAGEGAAGEGAAGDCVTQPQILYPARYPETIAVGATDISARIAPYSIPGIEIDVVAPGGTHTDPIFSTDIQGGYGLGNGTSQAAAHVSGLATLLLSVAKNKNLTPEDIRQILQETATDLGETWEVQGAGLINAPLAIEQARRW